MIKNIVFIHLTTDLFLDLSQYGAKKQETRSNKDINIYINN